LRSDCRAKFGTLSLAARFLRKLQSGDLSLTRNETKFNLPDFRRAVRSPLVVGRFPPFDFLGAAINAIAVHDRTRLGVSTAFGVVLFAKGKLKISVGRFFRVVSDAIQGDSFRINTVVLKGANQQGQCSVFIQWMGTRSLQND